MSSLVSRTTPMSQTVGCSCATDPPMLMVHATGQDDRKRWYHPGEECEEDRSRDGWTVSTMRHESHRNNERWIARQNWLEENCVCRSDPTTKWERLDKQSGAVCELVLVRYSIYRRIATLVNVRYRYLVVLWYFDISNESGDMQVSSIEWNIEYRMIRFLIPKAGIAQMPSINTPTIRQLLRVDAGLSLANSPQPLRIYAGFYAT